MKRKTYGLAERGFVKFYEKYTDIYQRYNEEVSLILGMKYGYEGIQPCHNNCSHYGCGCVSSSGDSHCGLYRGSAAINVEGSEFYIVSCEEDVNCECH